MLKFKVMHHSLIFYGSCERENCENKVASWILEIKKTVFLYIEF
jgi:Fur family ferric uptake transcriptional regulator